MNEENINDVNVELSDSNKEVLNSKAEQVSAVDDLKDNDILKTSDTDISSVNYLDASILEMKTVSCDNLDSINLDTKVDTSIYDHDIIDIKQNRIVKGRVVGINEKGIFVDIGFKSEGMVSKDELGEIPNINDEIEVYIQKFEDSKGNFVLSKQKADFELKWQELRRVYEDDGLVKGKIIKRIKGGMVVELGVIQGFLPGSQIEIYSVTDFDKYIDMECDFKIVKFNEIRKNIVLSRKELLNDEITEKRQEILNQMEVGMVLEGIVKNITDFGAFVNLGGIDGLLHITDITWGRINHPSDKINLGDKIKVKVIDFDVQKVKISLGMKQLEEEPWKNVAEKYPVGSKVKGKVVNLMNYGLFMEISEGIEGLIHISEISWTKHIKHPSDIYKVNDEIEAVVISLDLEQKKIALGIKQLKDDPWTKIENKYPVGSVNKGTVKHFTQYGAFVELEEGVDGLLHISDISWTELIKHPKEALELGDSINCKVLEVSAEDRKLAIGIKQLDDDPWINFKIGDKVKVKVNNSSNEKGILFDISNSVTGILPFEGLDEKQKEALNEMYTNDKDFDLYIAELNPKVKSIILSESFDNEHTDDSDDGANPKIK